MLAFKHVSTALLAAVLCLAGGATSRAAEQLRVVYPQAESPNDTRSEYFVKVLQLALARSGAAFEMQAYRHRMPKSRALLQLEKNDGIDVVWAVTTREREDRLLPVRIPIDKGLLGWRLLLVSRDQRAAFARVASVEQLRAFVAGQGHDWPDTAILRANQLRVEAGTDYEGLFRMLQANRFQYFPRSVVEIWDELDKHAALDLEVEPTLALHYRACLYFFVSRSRPELARRIEEGLRAAMADGSFEALFEQYHGEDLRRANFKGRRIIELHNPLFPSDAPIPKAGWFGS